MYDIIFLVVILFSLGGVIFIISRKFPQLSNLDVANLPEEQEAKKKKELISRRIEERGKMMKTVLTGRFDFIGVFWRKMQLQFRIYVGKIEKLLHHEQVLKNKNKKNSITPEEKKEKLASLLQQGTQWLQNGDYDRAEELFIEAVKMDVKSKPAYRGLGDAYFAKGLLDEAEETYKFLLQLDSRNDAVAVKLGEIAESKSKWDEAIQYYQQAVLINDSLSTRFYHLAEVLLKVDQPETAKESIIQAVELEPKNPKYLDLLIEIAIICGDKSLAENAYGELRLVNMENKKLPEFKERIMKI